MKKRLTAIILSLILVLGIAPAMSFAAHPEITTQLGTGLYFHDNAFYSKYAEGDINENFFVYTPNKDVTPYVAFGRDVAGAASFKYVYNMENENGVSILAGTNGDYFNMYNGVPIGIEIKDGIIKSSEHSSFEALGFFADGKAIIGDPGLNIKINDANAGIAWENVNYNKSLSDDSGVVLFNDDFNTHNYASKESFNVIITKTGGRPTAGNTITGTVKEIKEAEGRLELNEGEMALCIYKTSYLDLQNQMARIQAGDPITVTFTISDEWKNVTQAVGVKEKLLDEGNTIVFEDETRAPRTSVGIKKDGTIVLYTCDGRNAGGSMGLTLTELSRRMYQLGCYRAANLDGGASTQCFAVYPGDKAPTQVNIDSGSTLRSCGNYIMFKNNLPATGVVADIYVKPESMVLAPGMTESITVTARDTNWHAVDMMPDEFTYSVTPNIATVSNGAVTAGDVFGDGAVTVSYGKFSKGLALSIVNDWPVIETEFTDGKLSAKITDPANVGIEKSGITLTDDGKQAEFTYKDGIVSAEFTEGDGSLHHFILTVKNKNGHITRASLSENIGMPETTTDGAVTIEKTNIFADMTQERWSTKYTEYLYDQNIIAGSVKDGKTYYYPENKMTRQEFAKLIVAWSGKNPDDYSETQLAFADADKIAEWAVPYVKVAVSLNMMNGKLSDDVLKFDPEGSITRQEAMTVIGRLTESGYEKSDLSEFSDRDKVASWAYDYVCTLVKMGIISGSDGKLIPEGNITREQAAKIIFEIN